jgi:catechol 2,3-dioxygenase
MVSKFMYPQEKGFWTAMGLRNPDEIRMSDEIPPIGGLWTTGNLSARHRGVLRSEHRTRRRGAEPLLLHLRQPRRVLLALDWITENGLRSVMGAPTRHKPTKGSSST